MSAAKLRKEMKKQIDRLPEGRLHLAQGILAVLTARGQDETFEAFMNRRPPFVERMKQAEEDVRAGRGRDWRGIRQDV